MVEGEVAVFRKNASVYFEEDARVGFVCDGEVSKENGTRIEVKNGKISTFLEGQKIAFENDCEVEFLGIAKIRVDIPVEKEPPIRLSKKLDMNGRIGQNKFKKDKVATYQPNTTLFISKFAEIELQQRTKCLFEKPTTILNRYGLVFLTESGKIYEFRKMDTLVFPEQPAMMTIKDKTPVIIKYLTSASVNVMRSSNVKKYNKNETVGYGQGSLIQIESNVSVELEIPTKFGFETGVEYTRNQVNKYGVMVWDYKVKWGSGYWSRVLRSRNRVLDWARSLTAAPEKYVSLAGAVLDIQKGATLTCLSDMTVVAHTATIVKYKESTLGILYAKPLNRILISSAKKEILTEGETFMIGKDTRVSFGGDSKDEKWESDTWTELAPGTKTLYRTPAQQLYNNGTTRIRFERPGIYRAPKSQNDAIVKSFHVREYTKENGMINFDDGDWVSYPDQTKFKQDKSKQATVQVEKYFMANTKEFILIFKNDLTITKDNFISKGKFELDIISAGTTLEFASGTKLLFGGKCTLLKTGSRWTSTLEISVNEIISFDVNISISFQHATMITYLLPTILRTKRLTRIKAGDRYQISQGETMLFSDPAIITYMLNPDRNSNAIDTLSLIALDKPSEVIKFDTEDTNLILQKKVIRKIISASKTYDGKSLTSFSKGDVMLIEGGATVRFARPTKLRFEQKIDFLRQKNILASKAKILVADGEEVHVDKDEVFFVLDGILVTA
jgi:hypothetical protein